MNPDLSKMPYSDQIRYEISDFMKTPFQDASFRAITAISVIEHGFCSDALLKELSRLLMPGGFFIASFDYWPEKIDTSTIKLFGMDWRIFSERDLNDFVQEASEYGFSPVGKINHTAGDKVIHWGGQQYTFGWLVLEKSVSGASAGGGTTSTAEK
jgi:SAM-dependent methyltransferase